MGYRVVQPGRSLQTFSRNILPLSSGSKNERSKQHVIPNFYQTIRCNVSVLSSQPLLLCVVSVCPTCRILLNHSNGIGNLLTVKFPSTFLIPSLSRSRYFLITVFTGLKTIFKCYVSAVYNSHICNIYTQSRTQNRLSVVFLCLSTQLTG